MGVYIDANAAYALKHYKYSGCDLSYLYIHVLTPMNKYLIQFFPLWIAPNLITLIGLFVTLSAHFLTLYHNPSFDQAMPSWVYAYCSLAFFLYQTIDNLDGRQARRTGASSPLGLLFDHGVDALNVTIAVLILGSCYQFGSNMQLFALWLLGFVPFVFATWEEYWTGELILGPVNGPSDGMALNMIFVASAAARPGLWAQHVGVLFPSLSHTCVASYKLNMLIMVIGYTGVIVTVLFNIYNTARKRSLLKGPAAQLFPFATLLFCALTWALYSPSHIFDLHPRLFLWSTGLLFGNLICKLMLAHLTSKAYKILRTVLIPSVLIWSIVVLPIMLNVSLPMVVSEYTLLLLLFSYALGNYAHFVYHVINEITAALNINCLTLTRAQLEHAYAADAAEREKVRMEKELAAAAKVANRRGDYPVNGCKKIH